MDNIIKVPTVTVLMPVYNCELYIEQAVDSILNQTFNDFEFLIIDDASTDNTVSILKKYTDSRIKLILKPENSGLTNSLNYGLSIARGIYIARMDGDDISLPERFEKQVTFLEHNTDTIMCGTSFFMLGLGYPIVVPNDNEAIKVALLQSNSFGHPTVMIRTEVLKKLNFVYDQALEPAEDYDLWVRLVKIGKLSNLDEVLFHYRTHDEQVSNLKADLQKNQRKKTRLKMFSYFEFDLSFYEESVLNKFFEYENTISFENFQDFIALKEKIKSIKSNGFFDQNLLNAMLTEVEFMNCENYFIRRKNFSIKILNQYFTIRKKLSRHLHFKKEIKLIVKSIIKYSKK